MMLTTAGFCASCRELMLCPDSAAWPQVGMAWALRHRGHGYRRITVMPEDVARYEDEGVRVLRGAFTPARASQGDLS